MGKRKEVTTLRKPLLTSWLHTALHPVFAVSGGLELRVKRETVKRSLTVQSFKTRQHAVLSGRRSVVGASEKHF